jgi:hypothetical protein
MNPRDAVSVLKLKTALAASNARALARGNSFAQRLPEQPEGPPGEPGEMERYFDDHTVGPGLFKWRHYFEIYERHFGKFVGKEVHLAEIGIYSGGSLELWRQYLGPRVHVYGVDIEPACKVYEGPETRVYIGDQADPAFWARFVAEVPPLDIVIDDGGHETHQQIATLEALLPHLRPGGVYLCEDIHYTGNAFHSYVNGLSRQLHATGSLTSHNFPPTAFQQAVASIHTYPFVTVIERRLHPLAVLEAPRHGTEWQPFLGGERRGSR